MTFLSSGLMNFYRESPKHNAVPVRNNPAPKNCLKNNVESFQKRGIINYPIYDFDSATHGSSSRNYSSTLVNSFKPLRPSKTLSKLDVSQKPAKHGYNQYSPPIVHHLQRSSTQYLAPKFNQDFKLFNLGRSCTIDTIKNSSSSTKYDDTAFDQNLPLYPKFDAPIDQKYPLPYPKSDYQDLKSTDVSSFRKLSLAIFHFVCPANSIQFII